MENYRPFEAVSQDSPNTRVHVTPHRSTRHENLLDGNAYIYAEDYWSIVVEGGNALISPPNKILATALEKPKHNTERNEDK